MINELDKDFMNPVLENTIIKFIRQGKHEDAWVHTLDLEEIFRLYFQILIRLDQLNYIESYQLIQQVLAVNKDKTDPNIQTILYRLKLYQIVILLIINKGKGVETFNEFHTTPLQDNEFTLGMIDLINGMINNNPNYFQTSIDHLIASEELTMLAHSYNFLGHFLGGKKGIEIADSAINTFHQFGHINYENASKCFKGYLYQTLGDYEKARLFNTKALEGCTKNNWVYGIANADGCLGNIAIEEGNINEAIQRLEHTSKVFNQLYGYNPGIAGLLEAYRYSGKYDKGLAEALDTLNRMTIFSAEIYDRFFVELILLVLNMDNLPLAKDLYERFKSLVGNLQDDRIENNLKLCEALILKHSKSLGATFKSQSILRDLLKSTAISYHNRIEIIKQLCELLLIEYELYSQEEILIEIQEHINALTTIAREQKLIRLTFESRIIASKLELLNKDFGKARKILVDLLDYANFNNLSAYERVVSNEIAILDLNYQKWMSLVERNVSMREFMEKTNIRNYMRNAFILIFYLKQK